MPSSARSRFERCWEQFKDQHRRGGGGSTGYWKEDGAQSAPYCSEADMVLALARILEKEFGPGSVHLELPTTGRVIQGRPRGAKGNFRVDICVDARSPWGRGRTWRDVRCHRHEVFCELTWYEHRADTREVGRTRQKIKRDFERLNAVRDHTRLAAVCVVDDGSMMQRYRDEIEEVSTQYGGRVMLYCLGRE